MMLGRNGDWMKVVAARDKVDINPEYLNWSGLACFKKAYAIYTQRAYRPKLLAAAVRNFQHWTEIIGGDVVITIPWEWQVKFNRSDVKPVPRMHLPVAYEIVSAPHHKLPDFRRSYNEEGLSVQEFDTFGPTVHTLRLFLEGWHNFVAVIRDLMLPNPNL